ncbi:MAG TPA: undecaprenyl-diphosphate phosphatase [Saprospiraceae bacterium]|nr:undecaprenyl-diphosphate phosphatase [Saprospiraceae bacterium]
MKEILNSIILGIIQGLTEFLPVSSSGHLEIAKFILGDKAIGEESLMMTTVLHLGTAIATLIVFRKTIYEIVSKIFDKNNHEAKHFVGKIVLSMIPAAFVGVFFDDIIESFFGGQLLLVSCMLLVTAALLYLADRVKFTSKEVSYTNALIIGISQAIAILPGISRSGATISTAALLGIDKSKAAEFSFLMVVPLILGKVAKDLLEGEVGNGVYSYLELFFGFLAALIIGIFACIWMINIVKSSKLKYFAIYCTLVGIFGIVYWYSIN